MLLNGANPCNVYWQVGSSATLGTTTAFQGNLMALASISLNNGATVIGRLLARNGAVTLINNVLDGSRCNTGSGARRAPAPGTGTGTRHGHRHGNRRAARRPPRRPRPLLAAQAERRPATRSATTTRNGTTSFERTPHATCTSGFRATVRGKLIKRVVFSLDGKKIDSQAKGPYRVFVRGHARRAQASRRA